jgi:hypothetical protein
MALDIQKLRLINQYLSALGFDQNAAKLYLSLVEHGPQTLLSASRLSGIERTKLYRLVEILVEKGLIEETQEYKKRTIQAATIGKVELLVREKELQNQYLTSSFPTFSSLIQSLSTPFPGQKVIYYRGAEGIKQMTWNNWVSHPAEKIYRTYSCSFWNEIFGDNFTNKLSHEIVRQGFVVQDLYSDTYVEFMKNWFSKDHKWVGNFITWNSRYIPSETLAIDLNADIVGNTVAYYYWQGKEVFGVEIVNERFAKFQKQIHDILWTVAKKRPDVNWATPDKSLKLIMENIKRGKLPDPVPPSALR